MAMTTCKNCGEKYSDDSLICPHCEDLTHSATKKTFTDREKAAIQGFAGLLVIIFLLVGIARCSSDDKPESDHARNVSQQNQTNSVNMPTDSEKIEEIHKKLEQVEEEFVNGQKEFMTMMGKNARKGSKLTEQEKMELFIKNMQSLSSVLDKSERFQSPNIEQADAQRYITKAVDIHKEWALTQKAKLNAIVSLDGGTAKAMGGRCDELAMQEAMQLILAYKAVGLDPSKQEEKQ